MLHCAYVLWRDADRCAGCVFLSAARVLSADTAARVILSSITVILYKNYSLDSQSLYENYHVSEYSTLSR